MRPHNQPDALYQGCCAMSSTDGPYAATRITGTAPGRLLRSTADVPTRTLIPFQVLGHMKHSSAPLSPYTFAMRCPLLTYSSAPLSPYPVAMRCTVPETPLSAYATPGTGVADSATSTIFQRACYAKSSTDAARGTTSAVLLCAVWY
eukprot:3315879-Rhodomonas_salina.2